MLKAIFTVCTDLNKNLMAVLHLEYYLHLLYFFSWVHVGCLNGVRFVLLKKKPCTVTDLIKITSILLNSLKETFDSPFKTNLWGKNPGSAHADQ